MSKEKSWINPCGFELDGGCCKKKKISLEDHILIIEKETNVIKEKLKTLKKYMNAKYKHVKEDSLISQEYAFLNPPTEIKNVYTRVYHILQVNAMAIEELLKQIDEEDESYRKQLKEIKDNFIGLLCNVQYIIISEGLDFNDVTEELMSKAFKNTTGSVKIEKHFIAIRQIQANMKYLSDQFKEAKLKSDQKLKLKNPLAKGIGLDTFKKSITILKKNSTLINKLRKQ